MQCSLRPMRHTHTHTHTHTHPPSTDLDASLQPVRWVVCEDEHIAGRQVTMDDAQLGQPLQAGMPPSAHVGTNLEQHDDNVRAMHRTGIGQTSIAMAICSRMARQ